MRMNQEQQWRESKNKLGNGVSWVRGQCIGKGASGSVYLATSKNPTLRCSPFPPLMAVKSADVSYSASLQKEKQVFNNIFECPFIIKCFGEETTTNANGQMVYNLLLEYASGGSLTRLIKESNGVGLPESEVKRYTRSILLALNHIHEMGFVHCDLKPDNVLMVLNPTNAKYVAKIADFGLSKRAKPDKKRKLAPYLRGTAIYMAPEVVNGSVQEPPSDIWALGYVVIEMLTGVPGWGDDKDLDTSNLLKRIGSGHELPKIPSGISEDGKNFLKRCFVRNDKFRFTAKMLLDHPFVSNVEVEEFELCKQMSYEEQDCEVVSDDGFSGTSSFDHSEYIDEDGFSCYSLDGNGARGGDYNRKRVTSSSSDDYIFKKWKVTPSKFGKQHQITSTICSGA